MSITPAAADQDEVDDQDGGRDDVRDLRAHGDRSGQPRSRKCSRPKVRPGVGHHAAGAEQDARHEAAVVQGVVTDGQGLALAAEQDLLVGQQAAQAYGVHRDAVDVRAARAVQGGGGGVGLRRASRPRARAAAMSWAVRVAVPEGASTLFGWCSSTTSTDSK